MNPIHEDTLQCRLCQSQNVTLVKQANITTDLQSSHFAITDCHYGTTLDIYACADCGLLQSLRTKNITQYYQALEDPLYQDGRKERCIQARSILKHFKKYLRTGKILDVGAGSGILVEEALKMGYQAIGIEPSVWLQQKAEEHHLPVIQGVLPSDLIRGPFDAVTLIDVIEHVEDPIALLYEIRSVLAPNGLLILNTPDVRSFFAKALRWNWWHFRIAHITYFDKKTISMLLSKTGFEILHLRRPCWYFNAEYLFERIQKYLPKFLHMKTPAWCKNIIIPLNLFDSFEIVCRQAKR